MVSRSEIHGSQLESEQNSPWPFASESVLPSQCPGIHPMHSLRSCTRFLRIGYTSVRYTEHQPNLDKENESTSNYILNGLYSFSEWPLDIS